MRSPALPVADAIVDALRDWGVRYVFGVSGANIEHLHDAIHRRGGPLTSVLARREDGAGFMADCHARVRRTLGVCCSTSGGGMMNLAVGLAESLADGVPVLAVIGQPPATLDGFGAFQEATGRAGTVDAVGMLRAVTKYTGRMTDPDDLWPMLRTATSSALSGRPGSAALLVPRDIFASVASPRPADWPSTLAELASRPLAHITGLRKLFSALSGAHRPVLVLGSEVRLSQDLGTVWRFARRTRLPVLTTMSARGAYPEDDDLYFGMVGAAGHPSAHELVQHADLVLVVGSPLHVLDREPLTELPHHRVAVVTLDGTVARRAFPTAIVIEGDAGDACRRLADLWAEHPFRVRRPVGFELRHVPPAPEPAPPVAAGTLLASETVAALTTYLPVGGNIVVDAGNCGATALHRLTVPLGTQVTVALGMAGMGYSLPAAVGAQVGRSSGRTVVLCGDGSFLMNGFEIHTAVDLRLPVLYIVFNNDMHGMCVSRQRLFFGSRFECTRFGHVDVAAVARGFGDRSRLWVASAGTADELAAALAEYHENFVDRPGVLEVRLAREQVPPMTPFMRHEAHSRAGDGTVAGAFVPLPPGGLAGQRPSSGTSDRPR